jgi:pilus assembly protein CpaB
VDVLATVSPTNSPGDMTSKVVLTNVLVLAAGTRIEQDVENNKPVSVSVVTLQVSPMEAESLTLASTEGKIQLALRNPLDKTAPATPGIRPAVLLGYMPPRPATPRAAARPVPPPAPPTVEIIRGDRRAHEVVNQ